MSQLTCLYMGVDTIDINFQGYAGAKFTEMLRDGKSWAQTQEEEQVFYWGDEQLVVWPTGGAGFRYRVTGGYDESETWFFNEAKSAQGWNIRVSIGSAGLATKGFDTVWKELWERLEAWGCTIYSHAIGRIDVCADFEAPDFRLNPEAIVAHHRATNKDMAEFTESDGVQIIRRGRRVTSVTIGKMPGRQVIIYDKRRDVIDKQKGHWWEIWNVEDDTEVWRIEVRLGKRHLKDEWGVTTYDEMMSKLGDMLSTGMQDIRLTTPGNDSNASRWKTADIWKQAEQEICAEFEPVGHEKIGKVKRVRAAEQAEKYMRQVRGLLAGAAVCLGIKDDCLPYEFGEKLSKAICDHVAANTLAYARSRDRAKKRFEFITGEDDGTTHNRRCGTIAERSGTGSSEPDFSNGYYPQIGIESGKTGAPPVTAP